MKRYIKAASDSDSALETNISELKSDFDYIIDGFEKLSRMSTDDEKIALQIALKLSESFSEISEQIANEMIK